MGTRGAFSVEEIPSERWNLGLELLRDGGAMFVLSGEVPIGLYRSVGAPNADGCIHVEVLTTAGPGEVTPQEAQHHVDRGLAALRAAEDADARLGELLHQHGVVYEYVLDYGHGAVRLGRIGDDGIVSLD